MANNRGTDLARQLALLIDVRLADDWCSKPRVAVMRGGPVVGDELEMFEVDEPVASSLAELPRPLPGVVAVCLSALGQAVSETEASARVRVTVATSVGAALAIVRTTGSRHESRCVEGQVLESLRSWAGLPECLVVERSGRSRATPTAASECH